MKRFVCSETQHVYCLTSTCGPCTKDNVARDNCKHVYVDPCNNVLTQPKYLGCHKAETQFEILQTALANADTRIEKDYAQHTIHLIQVQRKQISEDYANIHSVCDQLQTAVDEAKSKTKQSKEAGRDDATQHDVRENIFIYGRQGYANGQDGQDGQDGQNGQQGQQGQNGQNGQNGQGGQNGQDGKDGKDGKDGAPLFLNQQPIFTNPPPTIVDTTSSSPQMYAIALGAALLFAVVVFITIANRKEQPPPRSTPAYQLESIHYSNLNSVEF